MDKDSATRSVVDAIAPHRWVTAIPDRHASEGTTEDIVVFDGPLAAILNINTCLPAPVDAVAQNQWVSTAMYCDTIISM